MRDKDNGLSITLTRAALAVLEEVRRDSWPVKPTPDANGLFQVDLPTPLLERLHAVSYSNETASQVIVRAYREGKFTQPLGSP